MRSGYALTSALPAAAIVILYTMLIFIYQPSLFNAFLYLGVPLVAMGASILSHLITQFMSCHAVDITQATIGATQTLPTVLIALLVSAAPACRSPIASVAAPIFLKETLKNEEVIKQKKSSCCHSTITLETIEGLHQGKPDEGNKMKGISYSFYLLFAMLFGVMRGMGLAAIC